MLSNVDKTRLVVRARVDAANSVVTSGQAGQDISGQDAIISRGVKTLEEREIVRVQRLSCIQRRHALNDNVAVAYNEPVSVDSLRTMSQKRIVSSKTLCKAASRRFERATHLWRRIVLGKGIGEESSNEVIDRQLQRERLVRRQALIEVWRKNELARGLLVLGSNTAHLDAH